MRFVARIGAITTASILACGSLGAAQPTEQTSPPSTSDQTQTTPEPNPNDTVPTSPSPSPSQPPQSSTTPSPTGQPSDTETSPGPSSPTQGGASNPLENVTCEVISSDDSTAIVTIPNAEEGDVVTVGDTTTTLDSNSQVKVTAQEGTSLELELRRDGASYDNTCTVTVGPGDSESPSEPPAPSEDNTSSQKPTPSPDPPTTPPPDPTTTPPAPTTEPTTPSEQPSQGTSGNGSGNTSVPGPVPSTPQPTPSTPPAQTAPAQPVPPPSAPSSSNNSYIPTPAAPTTQSSAHASGQTDRAPVDIRQYSDNPQYQLPQVWRTETNTGSRLIMPEPRDRGVQEPELETLPPASDEEIDAIKAQLSSPDHGNRLHSEDEHIAGESDGRFSGAVSWWLFSGIIGVLVLGTGIWWTVSRRKPKH